MKDVGFFPKCGDSFSFLGFILRNYNNRDTHDPKTLKNPISNEACSPILPLFTCTYFISSSLEKSIIIHYLLAPTNFHA